MPFNSICHCTLHTRPVKNVKSLDDRRSVPWHVSKYAVESNLFSQGVRSGRKIQICSECIVRIESVAPGPAKESSSSAMQVDDNLSSAATGTVQEGKATLASQVD